MSEKNEQKKALSIGAIQAVEDRKLEEVSIPEWGGVVYLRPMSGVERDEMETLAVSEDNAAAVGKKIKKFFILALVVDENGRQMFEEKDWVWLVQKNASALLRIIRHIRTANGLGTDAIKEIEKN